MDSKSGLGGSSSPCVNRTSIHQTQKTIIKNVLHQNRLLGFFLSVCLAKGSNDEKQNLPTGRAHPLPSHFYQKWENQSVADTYKS